MSSCPLAGCYERQRLLQTSLKQQTCPKEANDKHGHQRLLNKARRSLKNKIQKEHQAPRAARMVLFGRNAQSVAKLGVLEPRAARMVLFGEAQCATHCNLVIPKDKYLFSVSSYLVLKQEHEKNNRITLSPWKIQVATSCDLWFSEYFPKI